MNEINIEPTCTCGGACHEAARAVREALPVLVDCVDKGLLSWRTTPSVIKFREATDALEQIRWLTLPHQVDERGR